MGSGLLLHLRFFHTEVCIDLDYGNDSWLTAISIDLQVLGCMEEVEKMIYDELESGKA